jgi:hypothetical protein
MYDPDEFSRISKLFVDKDGMDPGEATAQRERNKLVLVCGPEVAISGTLQAAVLTAANIGQRCFGQNIYYLPQKGMVDKCLKISWPFTNSLESALKTIVPSLKSEQLSADLANVNFISFGTCVDIDSGLQVTYDGWSGAVAPKKKKYRMPERDDCVLSGILSGALAISEIFLKFSNVTVEAGRRLAGISLWRPDLNWESPESVGPKIEFLPSEFWLLGLGHLGQAYLWCLGMLPFRSTANVHMMLQDFDHVISANCDTGLLTELSDVGSLKTRICDKWLRQRGFSPRLIERAFGDDIRLRPDEPCLALCGFDDQGPRHILDRVGFKKVCECGLGANAYNFDAMAIHTFPNGEYEAEQVWSPMRQSADLTAITKLADTNAVYRSVSEKNKCGHIELAGKSVAVPFVGAIAGSLICAESIRMLHGGEQFSDINLRLECPNEITASYVKNRAKLSIRYQDVNR